MIKNETEASFDELDYIEENVIKEMYLGTSGREFQRSATERIQEALKNAAPEDDKETIKILNELEREEKDRWLRIVNAKKDVAKMRPETEVMEGEVKKDDEGKFVRAKPEEEIKQVRTKTPAKSVPLLGYQYGDPVAYKSLMHIKKGAPVSSIKRQVIEDDRKDMEAKNLVEQQKLSYYNFGLSKYSRDGVKKVVKLNLDTDDVILFGSRSEAEIKTKEWKEVLIKDSEGIELTPEEVKTSEEYIELGIYDVNTFTDFVIVQFNLIDSPRAPL